MEKLVTYNESNLNHVEISDLLMEDESSSYELTMRFELPKDLELSKNKQHLEETDIKDEPIIIQKLLNIVLKGSGIAGGMNKKTRDVMWSMGYDLNHKDFSFTCYFIIRGFGQTYYDDEYYDVDSEKNFFEDELDYLEDIDWAETQHLLTEATNQGISLEDEKADELNKFGKILANVDYSLNNNNRRVSDADLSIWKKTTSEEGFYYNYYKLCHSGDKEKAQNYRKAIYPFKTAFENLVWNIRSFKVQLEFLRSQKFLYIDPIALGEKHIEDYIKKTKGTTLEAMIETKRSIGTINNMMRDAKKFKENGEPIPTDFFDLLEDEGLKPK